jgi:hypothetical protein
VIQFASDKQRAEFFDLSLGLKKKVQALECITGLLYPASCLMVTSIKRDKPIKENDTHFLQKRPWRFIDIVPQGVPETEWEHLRVALNMIFPYSGKAGCESFTRFDHPGTGPHWHCQEKP